MFNEQKDTLKCPYCKLTFEAGSKTENRMIYYFCKSCGTVISVGTDHSVYNSFDLRKIKEKLQIAD